MSLTKQKAWVIFRADKLGHEEAEQALGNMSKDAFDAYECYAEDFELEIAKIGVEAQNEAATLTAANSHYEYLTVMKPWQLRAIDYVTLVNIFKGSKFEQLHLSAMFRVNNAELLLELVKP